MKYQLAAKSAAEARKEIKRRWPGQDVNYTGYYEDEAVIISLVRGASEGYVATVKMNRAPKATRFEAEVS